MSRTAAVLLALLVVVSVAACGDDGEPASLEGTAWVLESGVGLPAEVAVSRPTAAFTADTITGFGGCNRYSGSYSVDGDTIEISPLATTQMACPALASSIEADFFAALQEVARWSIEGGRLVLADADGEQLLRFDSAPTS